MNDRSETLHASAVGFIALVERDRDERCRELSATAADEARALERSARREARERAAGAVREARARLRDRVEAARADLSTQDRKLAHEVARTLLERGLALLDAELERRFADPAGRERWISSAIAEASRLLPRGSWVVELPDLARDLDRDALSRTIQAASGERPELRTNPELRAGIRLSSGGATLDATLGGLLANRSGVEGRLLRELARGRAP